MATNIIVAGVGGQGSVLASHIIAEAAIRDAAGSDVKVRVGETFGAAMRGGAVASHVRIGPDVFGPLVPEDEADLIVAIEPMEALRLGSRYLGPGGTVVMSDRTVPPNDVKVGAFRYPAVDEIAAALRELCGDVRVLDAEARAVEAGHIRTMSVVMVGAAFGSGKLPMGRAALEESIRVRVPPKTVDANLKAFDLGVKAVAGRSGGSGA